MRTVCEITVTHVAHFPALWGAGLPSVDPSSSEASPSDRCAQPLRPGRNNGVSGMFGERWGPMVFGVALRPLVRPRQTLSWARVGATRVCWGGGGGLTGKSRRRQSPGSRGGAGAAVPPGDRTLIDDTHSGSIIAIGLNDAYRPSHSLRTGSGKPNKDGIVTLCRKRRVSAGALQAAEFL